jgi:hypothetical protein
MNLHKHRTLTVGMVVSALVLGLFAADLAFGTEKSTVPISSDPMYMIVFGGKNKVALINSPTPTGEPASALGEPEVTSDEGVLDVSSARALSQQ